MNKKIDAPTIVVLLLLALLISCSNNDEVAPINPADADLPISIVMKNISSGTFTMGGNTVSGDAPEHQVTLNAFKMSYVMYFRCDSSVSRVFKRKHTSHFGNFANLSKLIITLKLSHFPFSLFF